MRLTMAEKRVLIKSFAPRYRKKGKKVKGEVLTEFTQMTGYNRGTVKLSPCLRQSSDGITLSRTSLPA